MPADYVDIEAPKSVLAQLKVSAGTSAEKSGERWRIFIDFDAFPDDDDQRICRLALDNPSDTIRALVQQAKDAEKAKNGDDGHEGT